MAKTYHIYHGLELLQWLIRAVKMNIQSPMHYASLRFTVCENGVWAFFF